MPNLPQSLLTVLRWIDEHCDCPQSTEDREDFTKLLEDHINALLRDHPAMPAAVAYDLGCSSEHICRYEFESAHSHLKRAVDNLTDQV